MRKAWDSHEKVMRKSWESQCQSVNQSVRLCELQQLSSLQTCLFLSVQFVIDYQGYRVAAWPWVALQTKAMVTNQSLMFNIQCFYVQCLIDNGHCLMFEVYCLNFKFQCSIINVQCSMINGQWSIFNGIFLYSMFNIQ